jgi:dTDP-4-dehydrorhamnose reductase
VTRWLITGAAGMLGTDLSAEVAAVGDLVMPLSREDLDIRDPSAVGAAVCRRPSPM